jgi:hypothetical protein
MLLLLLLLTPCPVSCPVYTLIVHSNCTLGELFPELALLSVSILLEYFCTKIRFSTPTLSALLGLAGQIYLS